MGILLLAILCGLGAAVLRGFQLTGSFDSETALIPAGDTVTIALMVLSAVFAAVVIATFLLRRGKAAPQPKTLPKAWLVIELAALAALALSSSFDLANGFTEQRVSSICLGFLGLAGAASLLMITKRINALPSAAGFWATVPVFWSCLMMIMEFWGHAGNPVRNTYVYGMFATVFCTLALYAAAGFFFGKANAGRVFLYALPGVYFATLTLGGALLAEQLGQPIIQLSTASLLRYAFIVLHLSAVVIAVQYGRLTPPKPEPEDEPNPENGEETEYDKAP
ncbi:MAG: hypothetical protein FWG31_00385 [Oscillospiraceae bacterium]|nr:hypothetical protein [Oscillospiraceae bacterium]